MSHYRDIRSNLIVEQNIRAQAATADVNGAAIDRAALGGDVLTSGYLVGSRGTETGGPSADTVQFILQDSADGSTDWQTVTNRDPDDVSGTISIQTAVLSAPGDEVVGFDLSGARRYVRVTADVVLTGGTSPTVPIACSLAFNPLEKP